MSSTRFKQREPRRSTIVECHCYAKQALFKPWEQMTEAAKAEFDKNGPIPCEGGGLPGEWCAGCRFGKVGDPEDV